jgi:sterol desaturase/sphingolipid hydroxylase (fatty acid hydroxylase superfamily)
MLKKLLQYGFYPTVMFFSMFTAWYLVGSGKPLFLSMLIPVLLSSLIIFAFEFIMPYEKSWRGTKKIIGIDILHSLVTSLLITPTLKALILALLIKYETFFATLALWPSELPFMIQLILAILLADLLIYMTHRWMHSSKLGWRIHVVHHTTEKMNLWAASRTHPLNSILVYTLEVGTLLFLGTPSEVLAVWTVFMSVNGFLSHSNIDLKLGFLNRVFSTPALHRVHHNPDWKYSNSNFGNTTCVWDQLFGTYLLPDKEVRKQGIMMHKVPENYFDHLMVPFVLDRYKVQKQQE